MDDFTKQKLAEAQYKEIRNSAVQQENIDYNSPNYKEVKPSNITPTYPQNAPQYSTEYKEDFDKASKDFWQKNTQTGLGKYNGGSMIANFGKEDHTLEEFFDKLAKLIKEGISNEFLEKKISAEELTINFNAVTIALKLLAKNIQKINSNINITNIISYIHGFINSYISNIIKKKLK